MIPELDDDEILRLFGVSIFTVAGVAPTGVVGVRSDLNPNRAVILAPNVAVPAIGGGSIAWDINRAMIIGPRHILFIDWFGGDGATIIDVNAYGVPAPLGTVFHC